MRVSFGHIGGNQWEEYCQKLFKLKYENQNYQEIPARYSGDLGLEGHTTTGKAFQCYCPDNDPTSKELYEGQRDKITDDIGKLIKNEFKLLKILGATKIKSWYLVTPKYENKDLLAHCKKKASHVLSKKCSHIAEGFDVFIQTETDYMVESTFIKQP
jgi:hypothetical protein